MIARLIHAFCLAAVASLLVTPPASGQFKKMKKAAERAAEREAEDQVEKAVRNAIRCAVGDRLCVENAKKDGQPVVITDEDGEVITDENGNPITDPEAAQARTQRPGEGVWANYDFVPGERVLFVDDFADDRVGDFPRRLEFVGGNMEVVEWEGRPYLRVTNRSTFRVSLPDTLPRRFTIEFDYHQAAGHLQSRVLTTAHEGAQGNFAGSYFQVGNTNGVLGKGPQSTTVSYRTREAMTPVRIHVDGSYAKMYLGEMRVANIPNAAIVRGSEVEFRLLGRQGQPAYLGDLRIAAGGGDLYDRLEAEGRVTTRGILFDVDSHRIRPESTPTLEEIGRMLEEHPELRIAIEGHTDSDGEEAYNQDLSERRAGAVRQFMIDRYGVGPDRLQAAGYGESRPVVDNSTPEGRQQNRRVELVKIESE